MTNIDYLNIAIGRLMSIRRICEDNTEVDKHPSLRRLIEKYEQEFDLALEACRLLDSATKPDESAIYKQDGNEYGGLDRLNQKLKEHGKSD